MSYTYNELSALNRNKLYKGLKNIFSFSFTQIGHKMSEIIFYRCKCLFERNKLLIKSQKPMQH
jgi:hypothetical protein